LQVGIEDNGCGFDPSAPRPAGNGLRNLRQRFHDLGGVFELTSKPGVGTRVVMTIPLMPPRR
jgi:signal transduction histidine kinase